MQAKPVIPWLGGKRRLAGKLIPMFPEHECYVELFCGGAALYFMRDPARVEESLSAAHLRLNGTTVERLPWDKCLVRYDRPHTFFYADPPYWQVEGYGVDFGFENYERMAEMMRSCQGTVMVSINDHPDIRRVFTGFYVAEAPIKYSLASKAGAPRQSRELIASGKPTTEAAKPL